MPKLALVFRHAMLSFLATLGSSNATKIGSFVVPKGEQPKVANSGNFWIILQKFPKMASPKLPTSCQLWVRNIALY